MTVTEPTDTRTHADTDLDLRADADFEAQVGAVAESLFMTGLHAFEAITICLGRELGLYDHLVDPDGLTAAGLAAVAGIDARYAREWLEQQAMAGLVDVRGDVAVADDDRRYGLSPAVAECLLRPDSPASSGPIFDFLATISNVFPGKLVDAYRTGDGVPYADYAVHDAQGDFNRPLFATAFTSEWLPQVPGLVERLAAPGARVVEIGPGEGWGSIAIARAWPGVEVVGIDVDEASIEAAQRHADEAGVGDRVRFVVADAATGLPVGLGPASCDLVFAFEMVHDLAHPRQVLGQMKELAKPDGTVLVVDERAAETFEPDPENAVERFLYVASVLHCLPVGRTEPDSAETGTVMRPSTLEGYAVDAGFETLEILPIEHDLFRAYRLV